jgi:hypothetical protein
MDDTERNAIAMAKTVRTYMNQGASKWNGLPAFVTVMTELDTMIGDVNSSVQRQETPTTGITLDKATARNALEELILEVGGALFALANSLQPPNHAMAAEVSVNPSDLDTMAEQRIDDVATRICRHADKHKDVLDSDFGVTGDRIAELDAARTAFQGVKSNPRSAIAGKAGETATLPEKIRGIKSLLRLRLDKMMLRFRTADPEFYAGYRTARVIVDRRGPGGGDDTPTPPAPPTP